MGKFELVFVRTSRGDGEVDAAHAGAHLRAELQQLEPNGRDGGIGELTVAQTDAALALGVEHLAALQEKLYAQDRWAMLCVFQAMDAAGRRHVMSGVNPQGVHVTSFKAPGPEALAHDFLQRCVLALPERGRIGIFNRSHYEEVLVVRVHPESCRRSTYQATTRKCWSCVCIRNLQKEHYRELLGKKLWKHRMDAIAALERHLSRQGTVVMKFFLHVSKAEQKRRFLERLEEKDKH